LESFQLMISGFGTALQPTNLLFAVTGCIMGTLVGVLPGLGPSTAIAILIPVTFVLDPTPAIIMLAAIYYGSQYGGTITSVLINTPGEAASAVTCIEGYEMAKQGRAGSALSIAAIGSFFGGTVSTLALMLIALPLTRLALKFGPPESFALIVMALSLVTALAGQSIARAMISAMLGLLIGMAGVDPSSGVPRFTFGQVGLLDGFGIVPVAMGLFGISEILLNAENPARRVFDTKLSSLFLTRKDLKDSIAPIIRGAGIGFFFGVIPGIGGVVPTFMSYIAEKKLSKTPEKFGTGVIEGVAGPETANNASCGGALVPLFTLGIPGSPSVAILMGAFMMNGLIPGPFLFRDHAEFVWAVIASMYIGNLILVILNLPLIPIWVSILKIPYSLLFGLILLFCVVGAYGEDNSVFGIGIMLGFGLLGYLAKKLDFPIAPLILTMILGPMMERGLRQSLEMSQGDFSIFFSSPISVTLLAVAVLFVLLSARGVASQVKGSDSQV
jgi:putative tricarboxylic transport membrane protein